MRNLIINCEKIKSIINQLLIFDSDNLKLMKLKNIINDYTIVNHELIDCFDYSNLPSGMASTIINRGYRQTEALYEITVDGVKHHCDQPINWLPLFTCKMGETQISNERSCTFVVNIHNEQDFMEVVLQYCNLHCNLNTQAMKSLLITKKSV